MGVCVSNNLVLPFPPTSETGKCRLPQQMANKRRYFHWNLPSSKTSCSESTKVDKVREPEIVDRTVSTRRDHVSVSQIYQYAKFFLRECKTKESFSESATTALMLSTKTNEVVDCIQNLATLDEVRNNFIDCLCESDLKNFRLKRIISWKIFFLYLSHAVMTMKMQK